MIAISRIAGILMLAALLAVTGQCTENSTENARLMASEGIETVQVGDIEMAYKVMGQGEPLVMIIGLNAAMDLWDRRFLDDLSSSYQVIIFDNRGVGYTTASSANFSIEQFANDTAGLIDALGLERANVLGYSMGSLVAQELAINHPEKVDKLILFASSCGGPQAVQPDPEIFKAIPDLSDPSNLTSQELKGFFEIMFPPEWLAKNPDVYRTFSQANESSSPENMMRQTMAVALWPGSYDRLDNILAPTLIVAGMKDAIGPFENSITLAERINGSRLVMFEDAGHGLVFQYPDELARIVEDFIELSAADPFAQSLNASSGTSPDLTEKARIMASEGIKTVQVGDIEMAYKVMGQGEPLVMIIGGNGAMDWWPPEFLANLSSKYKVIVFDNRGMGYTTASPANFSISQFANDTAGLMDAIGIKQANILGISMGGFVAQELAIDHPEKVKRLILLATYCGGPQATAINPEAARKIPDLSNLSNLSRQDIKNFSEVMYPQKWLAENPDFYNRSLWVKETSLPENLKRQLVAIYQWPGSYDRLDRVKAPTLIVAGMDDLIVPPENSLILANRINGSWLVRLENAGHGLVIQYPDKLVRIVTDFIELSPSDSFVQSLNSSSLEPAQEKIEVRS